MTTTTRKNFNYRTASVSEIVEHFKKSSAQAIYAARSSYSDSSMTAKIEEAYKQYKIEDLCAKLSSKL